ncbi:hypothetical protein FRC08_001115 [Ceratobasidium sp. 394]|nr:hypothetical protein FRC08_001115 [Ceratobasidium sp. 394]
MPSSPQLYKDDYMPYIILGLKMPSQYLPTMRFYFVALQDRFDDPIRPTGYNQHVRGECALFSKFIHVRRGIFEYIVVHNRQAKMRRNFVKAFRYIDVVSIKVVAAM